jgi:hypothetical protein
MKYHNRVKRLQKRQEIYDKMIANDGALKNSYRRPGSLNK